jgi:hypothetical protein
MGFITIIDENECFKLKIGDSEFKLRRFDSQHYAKLVKKHTHKYWKRGQECSEIDETSLNAELYDYIIQGWTNIKHPITNEDVPCIVENKVKLPSSVKVKIIEECDSDSLNFDQKKNQGKS